jgi:[acyl-carrier-protein] S-malonyltransferase
MSQKTALLFAGQGSQTVGMGRDLAERFEGCRHLYESANAILDRNLQSICLGGPEEVLTKTDNAQPAIFLTSLVCLAALQAELGHELGFQATAGLSLGEFTALTAAGALSFSDGLELVQARGRFMQEACEATHGAMASVIGMEESPLAEVCREADVDLANLNCPGQIVISGEQAKIARAVELAKARGAKRAIPLQVAGAYHSRLMATAQVKVATELERVALTLPRVPVVSNVTARPGADPAAIKDLLVRQVTSPVRWTESMQWLIAAGFTRFIELGPGNVLAGLMKRINKDVTVLSVSDGNSLAAALTALRATG